MNRNGQSLFEQNSTSSGNAVAIPLFRITNKDCGNNKTLVYFTSKTMQFCDYMR